MLIANTRTREQKTSGHDVRGPLPNEMFGVGINSGPILSCRSHGLHTGRITTDANEKTTALFRPRKSNCRKGHVSAEMQRVEKVPLIVSGGRFRNSLSLQAVRFGGKLFQRPRSSENLGPKPQLNFDV